MLQVLLHANKLTIMPLQQEADERNRSVQHMHEKDRTTETDLVMCGECNGFYEKKCFRRHTIKCTGELCNVPCAVPVNVIEDRRRSIR